MTKKDFSATEVMMILERMEKQFREFSEAQQMLKERVDAIFEMVVKNAEDIEMIKLEIDGIKLDIKDIKQELKIINKKLDQKVEGKEFTKLEKRVSFLERKLKIA